MAIPSRFLRRFRLLPGTLALLALMLSACADGSTGPSASRPAQLALQPVLPVGAGAVALSVDQVRVQLLRPPDQVVADTILQRDPRGGEFALELRVMIAPPAEELLIRIEFFGSGSLLFQGEQSVLIRPLPATNEAPQVSMVYMGPGANAMSLAVVPGDSVLTFGDSVRLRVEALDGQGQAVSPVYVSWSVDDARVGIDAKGLVRAPSARISVVVKARTPGGVEGTGILRIVPAPAQIRRLSQQGYEAQVGSPVPLEVEVLGADGLGILLVPVTFVATGGGGSVAPGTVLTDGNGKAAATATLGSVAGPQSFEARVQGLNPVPFSFTAFPSPAIALNPTTVEFAIPELAAGPAVGQVTVTNSGGGTLSGLAASVEYFQGQPTGWLAAALSAAQAPATLTMTATRGNLPVGTYAARVWVSSATASNSPQPVEVTLRVVAVPARIQVSPTQAAWEIQFGESPVPQQISVANSGGGTLSGLQVTVDQPVGAAPWLSASLSSTTAPATLTLTPAAQLAPGTYTAQVVLSSPAADNSPVSIPATLLVGARPRIQVSAEVAAWEVPSGQYPGQQQISVTNGGGGTLSGLQVTVDQPLGAAPWLSASLSSTTAPATLTLTPAAQLPLGSYTAQVVLASPVADNSPVTILATLNVFSPPRISGESWYPGEGGCAETSYPYSIWFQYVDDDGDMPVRLSPTGGAVLYGQPILLRYQILPAGGSGSLRYDGSVDGGPIEGTAWFVSCVPGSSTNDVAISLSVFDLGGHESNRLNFTILAPR